MTTTLAEMRREVAREHGWHEDDDGDRIDEVLNERFGQAAVEMYEALEWNMTQFCEGFCRELPSSGFYMREMDNHCSGCRSRHVIAKARGEA